MGLRSKGLVALWKFMFRPSCNYNSLKVVKCAS